MIRLCCGDCLERLTQIPTGTIDAVITDPPYGLEFHKEKDSHISAGFSQGGSVRFSLPIPSYGRIALTNRICKICKGTERGRDRKGFHRCVCVSPDFPQRKAGDTSVGTQIQDFHFSWLREAHRVLTSTGTLRVFSDTRTYHRLQAGMENAGFKNIQLQAWGYGNGFPKSTDLSNQADDTWQGWSTTLKPSWEVILIGTKT